MAYYFAYGSNMDTPQMQQRLEAVRIVGQARFKGYRLVFDKISKDRTGKANLLKDEQSEVWGVVYEMTDEQMRKLDSFERGYDRAKVEVELDNGKRLQVYTYISEKRDPSLRPKTEYVNTIINGANKHGLPKEYIRKLQVQAGCSPQWGEGEPP
jgi:gamma-glutamylcyclotransferase